VARPKRGKKNEVAPSKAERARRTRGSRYWVSGYPRLVREWHPTKNGTFQPDEVRFASHKLIWWTCAKGPDHAWLKKSGLRERSYHSLRHYFITELVRRGAGLEAVRVLAGHSTLAMTERCAHATGDDLKAAIRKLGK
jgi:site-specific recombinase XerD